MCSEGGRVSERDDAPRTRADLCGYWSGEYWYGAGMGKLTQFAAHITDSGDGFEGTTLESADIGWGVRELTACITGVREGAKVEFVKRYDAGQRVHREPIFYAGDVDAALTVIEGRWLLTEWIFRLNGGFRMKRGSQAAALVEKRETRAPVTVDR
mgnify:CR=1 FL=1